MRAIQGQQLLDIKTAKAKYIEKDQATLLQCQLQKRFGELPVTYMQHIADTDAKTLLN